jgi:hypothetical protein
MGGIEHESEPGRMSVQRRHPGGCIGCDTDEGCLSEGHDTPDAREQREADGDERIDADVVHQRDAERAQEQGSDRKTQHRGGCGKSDVKARHSSISSSECSEASDRQIRIGISSENTITSFRALLSKDAKLSRIPTPTAPIAAPG